MNIDSTRFPHTARYIASLQNGLSSYPECRELAASSEHVCQVLAKLKDDPGLPPLVLRALRGEIADKWYPEVLANALLLLVRDAIHTTDTDYTAWAYEDSQRVFRSPLFRMIIAVLSPSLAIFGATKRWSAFHEGSSLANAPVTINSGRAQARVTLAYPTGLFNHHLLVRHREAFRAALHGTKANDLQISFEERSKSEALYSASWVA